jgi:hypothetical protein
VRISRLCEAGAGWNPAIRERYEINGAENQKSPRTTRVRGLLEGNRSFRQLAAAPELRSSPSAMVTTTTTLPTSRTIDDACSEERIEPIAEEADM